MRSGNAEGDIPADSPVIPDAGAFNAPFLLSDLKSVTGILPDYLSCLLLRFITPLAGKRGRLNNLTRTDISLLFFFQRYFN
ncbi:hypothetical protein [Chimaeribacter arupi]|uniref:hypothetical protein n=1 Tax=Chimaeribacter arupi TaxID=2060066 RepID=UPI0013FD0B96|nr:hypothetical protein [Chimaeribacter arupi]WKZ90803.1 hypothetical protein P0E69_11010 [Chimaeribacter arupi]